MAKPKEKEMPENFAEPVTVGEVVGNPGEVVEADFDEVTTQDAAEQYLDDMAASAVAAETMVGDLLGALVDEIRTMPDVWQKTSEAKQGEIIDRLTRRVEYAVKQACYIIASDNRPTIRAELEQIVLKDGIKAVLTIAGDEPARHEFFDAKGTSVLVVMQYAEQYSGGKDQVKPDKDQPEIPLNTVE
jgi:hypothetical protein